MKVNSINDFLECFRGRNWLLGITPLFRCLHLGLQFFLKVGQIDREGTVRDQSFALGDSLR